MYVLYMQRYMRKYRVAVWKFPLVYILYLQLRQLIYVHVVITKSFVIKISVTLFTAQGMIIKGTNDC